jgi:hypothetical protein
MDRSLMPNRLNLIEHAALMGACIAIAGVPWKKDFRSPVTLLEFSHRRRSHASARSVEAANPNVRSESDNTQVTDWARLAGGGLGITSPHKALVLGYSLTP